MTGRVLVGMSGGVDSAVAAYILKESGYEVIGLTLRTWDSGDSRCCAIEDARETARILGIPYHVQNCVSEFNERVVKPFIKNYISGNTPSPCVICNREVKWERMMYAANVLKADFIATGHYSSVVQLENGRYAVVRGTDDTKDQSYMLYRLTQEQLSRTIMPLGGFSKTQVRRIAEEAGLPSASSPDSQEICFVTDGDYGDYIVSHAEDPLPGEGAIVDSNNQVLGKHRGLFRYTTGQRRGLGVSGGKPLYVIGKNTETNTLIIGEESELYSSRLTAGSINWMAVSGLDQPMRCRTKIRFSHSFADALVVPEDNDHVAVEFDTPQRAVTPGQSVVFYDGDTVVGGGIIE